MNAIPEPRTGRTSGRQSSAGMTSTSGLQATGSPAAASSSPARHTCNDGAGPYFGRKTAGCPRCEELLAGAAPRSLAWVDDFNRRREHEAQSRAASVAHFAAGGPHARGECGPVCTFGDW